MVVIKDDKIIEEDKESNEPIYRCFFGKFKGLLPLEYYTKFVLSVDLNQVVLLPWLSYLPLVSIATPSPLLFPIASTFLMYI